SNAAIGERLGKCRPRNERAVVTLQRLVMAVERQQHAAAVAEHVGMIWPQGERAIVARQRQLALAQGRLSDGEHVNRIEVVTVGGYYPLAQLLGVGELSGFIG